jgi:alpha-glucuronidase
MLKKGIILFSIFFIYFTLNAEDGYRLWLRYDLINNNTILEKYKSSISGYMIFGKSATLDIVHNEIKNGLNGLLGIKIENKNAITNGIVLIGTPQNSPKISSLLPKESLLEIGDEGFLIKKVKTKKEEVIIITANSDIGLLYGTYHFLMLLQTNQDIDSLNISSAPKTKLRILNHWDNLDRTVERGYAGFSLWDWHRLPDYKDPRYIEYARANASIGINGTVLTNVNANALILTPMYLEKVKALADIFRPFGIKVYLTARFSSPSESGDLETADPLDPTVRQWWKNKADEIYKYIPDFGGFLVKANSEGQPGPQNYNRTHADGANMLADALAPHGGIVMWRAFVYSNEEPEDRAKQANNEFNPLDGSFRKNVMIQVKNGPIDFQPREPFHPLFGTMPKTPLMMEFQITQEYLGQSTNLVFLASLYKEVLSSDTYAKGKGSTVAKVVDGSIDNHQLTGMAGVSNIGNDRNWTGHLFGQANWFSFGKLAWDYTLTESSIAEQWLRMTFSNNPDFIEPVKKMMLESHEIVVSYSTPLGLHHLMAAGHHYGPGPWVANMSRADWTSVYYHRADSLGLGFDRTTNGSDAVSQYHKPVKDIFNSRKNIPEKYLMWFHHIEWDYKMKSGNTMWEELCFSYHSGVEKVREMRATWAKIEGKIDQERFIHVSQFLQIQEKEAIWWRNSCLLYFQTFSKKPFPAELEKLDKSLDYYMNLNFPYAPGIKPRW